MNTLLELYNISFSYRPNELILKNICFKLSEGESLGILGPNGGGKTTLLKILVGLLRPLAGKIRYQGIDITSIGFPSNSIAYISQTENIKTSLPLMIKDIIDFGFIKNQKLYNTLELLKMVGLNKPPNTLITELSGGENQRVLMAKALASSPKILILDEPTKGLDSKGQDQLLLILDKIKTEQGTSIIIVDHNINQVIKHCDKILCLNRDFHWHEKSELLKKEVIESTYHCEFEHLLIHEHGDDHITKGHVECHQNHGKNVKRSDHD